MQVNTMPAGHRSGYLATGPHANCLKGVKVSSMCLAYTCTGAIIHVQIHFNGSAHQHHLCSQNIPRSHPNTKYLKAANVKGTSSSVQMPTGCIPSKSTKSQPSISRMSSVYHEQRLSEAWHSTAVHRRVTHSRLELCYLSKMQSKTTLIVLHTCSSATTSASPMPTADRMPE